MASIREVRKTLLPVLIGLVVLDLACVGYLLSPAGRSRESRQRDLDVLNLKLASTDIAAFYKERFPTEYSQVSEELGKLAAQSGVQIAAVKYDDKDAPVEGLRKLNIEVALSGGYLQEAKFINALERDKLFFVIDGVTLGEQQGNVRLQIKVETYLRSAAGTS